MNKTEILVIGRNEEILQTVIRLINNNSQWNGTGVCTDEEAIEKFHHRHFDIVLLTNGISDKEEKKLKKIFTHQNKDIIIIQHYGGGSGLLSNEILEALRIRKEANQPTYLFRDDIFKKE
jgi:hypothetical protein